MIAEKDRILALTDKMFPPEVAAEIRRLVESGQGFTEADLERISKTARQRALSKRSELLENT